MRKSSSKANGREDVKQRNVYNAMICNEYHGSRPKGLPLRYLRLILNTTLKQTLKVTYLHSPAKLMKPRRRKLELALLSLVGDRNRWQQREGDRSFYCFTQL